ncbi:MAG: hypothetical protein ABSC55_11930 [Syntrophorhabdales bacterium]
MRFSTTMATPNVHQEKQRRQQGQREQWVEACLHKKPISDKGPEHGKDSV